MTSLSNETRPGVRTSYTFCERCDVEMLYRSKLDAHECIVCNNVVYR